MENAHISYKADYNVNSSSTAQSQQEYVPHSSGQRRSPYYITKPQLNYKIMIVDVSTQGSDVYIESGDFDYYIGEYETKIIRKGLLLSVREARSVLYYTNRYMSRATYTEEADAVARYMSSAYLRVRYQVNEYFENSYKLADSASDARDSKVNAQNAYPRAEYVSDAYKRVVEKYSEY